MLIVYDSKTGEVLDNHGTSSAWPEGPPDRLALVNLPDRTLDDVGLLRLHDVEDADLVAEVLASRYHVDDDKVVIDGPLDAPLDVGWEQAATYAAALTDMRAKGWANLNDDERAAFFDLLLAERLGEAP